MSDSTLLDSALLALIGFAVTVGGLCGWDGNSSWAYMKERRAAERTAQESSLWTPTDDDWLESNGIGYG